jgi:F5/8 type C domain
MTYKLFLAHQYRLLALFFLIVLTACETPTTFVPTPLETPTLPKNPISDQDWFAVAKYGLLIHFLPRDGAYPILAAPEGTWNKTVEDFDVPRFVAEVKATGAAYVIFTVGQNSGYYVAPSEYFMEKTGTFPGQYVSERDLIADLAKALAAENIKLMVYTTADGPIAAPEQIKAGLGVVDAQAGPAARASMKAMMTEWSQRWGSAIAGWWVDGCYPWLPGYGNPVDGEQNIDALLAATLAGNPDALTTCNPSAQRWNSVSKVQNYMAGEEDFFHRYPGDTPETFRGKELIWHVVSYLGDRWGDGQQVRYPPEQLASYIQHVSDRSGVVTIDMGIQSSGALFPWQLQAMKQVKRVVRDDVRLVTNNLALYKTARLMSHTTNEELPTNGAAWMHYAYYGVDGVVDIGNGITSNRFAMPGNEWAWSFLLDLDFETDFSRAVIIFPSTNFPTDFNLEVSDDALSWQVVSSYAPTGGGTYTLTFPKVTARYVRVKSNKPDGPGQAGAQMGISELELYKK